MRKNSKTVLKSFDYLHCDDFAAYLMEMSRKGWHFKEWGVGLVFERGKPEEITYAVEVFIDGSEYTTRPEVETEEFAEYCEAAGWKLMDAKRKFCIFKKVRDDADDILTDQERLDNIAREERKILFRQLGLALWFSFLQILNFSGRSFVNYIFSNDTLFVILLWSALLIGAVARAIAFFIWKKKLQSQIDRGEKAFFGKTPGAVSFIFDTYSWAAFAVIGAYALFCIATDQYNEFVFAAAIFIPLIIMAYLIAKFRPDAVTNQVIQTIMPCIVFIVVLVVTIGVTFSDDAETVDISAVPLMYEDIGGDAGELEEITLDGSTSIFGSALRCWLYYEEDRVYYQVYKSDYSWVLDKICLIMEKSYDHSGMDVKDTWNAELAKRYENGCYLVRYPDGVLIFIVAEDTIFTEEQAKIIHTALLESR